MPLHVLPCVALEGGQSLGDCAALWAGPNLAHVLCQFCFTETQFASFQHFWDMLWCKTASNLIIVTYFGLFGAPMQCMYIPEHMSQGWHWV